MSANDINGHKILAGVAFFDARSLNSLLAIPTGNQQKYVKIPLEFSRTIFVTDAEY